MNESERKAVGSREILVAAGEAFLVILPFLFVSLIRDYFSFLYNGPLAILAGALIATWLLRRRGLYWRDMGIRRPKHWGKTILGVVATFLAIFAAGFAVFQFNTNILGLEPPDISALAVVRESFWTFLIFVGPLSWGTAAFGEEMIARGFIMNRFAEVLGGTRSAWIWGLVLQGLIFGAAHSWQGPAGMINTGLMGMIFGASYLLMGRNLWVTILTHGLIDSITIISIYVNPMAGG